MKKVKASKILCMVMCVLSLAALTVPKAEAIIPVTENQIMPLWDNTSGILPQLNFCEDVGYADASVTGYTGCSHIEATVTVYRKSVFSWVEVDSWTDEVYGDIITISEQFDATQGTKYKLVVEASVTLNGVVEDVEKEITKTYQ